MVLSTRGHAGHPRIAMICAVSSDGSLDNPLFKLLFRHLVSRQLRQQSNPYTRHACEKKPPESMSDMSLGRPGVSAEVSEAQEEPGTRPSPWPHPCVEGEHARKDWSRNPKTGRGYTPSIPCSRMCQ
jgi:hypothetical protein